MARPELESGHPAPFELYQSVRHTRDHVFTEGIEGPVCDYSGYFYAVNWNHLGSIGVVTPQGDDYLFVDLPPGSTGNGLRLLGPHELRVADYTGHNILRVDMRSRKVSVWAHEPSMHQPNDICVTATGMMFASDPDWKNESGRIWRCPGEGKLELAWDGLGTTNGIEVSFDEKILYVNESVQRRIWAFDLDAQGGLRRQRLFAEFPDHGLDGMRCDVKGNLYVTRYGKGTVAMLAPSGELLREIAVGCARPSNLCFGGEDGRRVYVCLVDEGRVERFEVEHPGREWALAQLGALD